MQGLQPGMFKQIHRVHHEKHRESAAPTGTLAYIGIVLPTWFKCFIYSILALPFYQMLLPTFTTDLFPDMLCFVWIITSGTLTDTAIGTVH